MNNNVPHIITARELAMNIFRDLCALLALAAFGAMVLAWSHIASALN